MDKSLLRLEQVSVRKGGRLLLDHIDLCIPQARIITLMGPNGAGKSTLVRVAIRCLRPSNGQVWQRPGLRIGYVPQKMHIDPVLPLSVARFLTLGSRHAKNQLRAQLDEVGAELELTQSIHSLSGGEWQRVMLARALLRQPQLLILDEPVQGVDVLGQQALYQLIAIIRDRYQCGILMVSHDLHLVMRTTDQVLCLNRHLCCSGHPDTISHDPAFIRLFGQQDSLGVYTHHHDHEHDAHGNIIPTEAQH